MQYKIAQVIGLNTDQKAAQVISSQRDENNLFLASLQLVCDDAFTKGRQILSELLDFYSEKEGSVSSKLTDTFAELKKKIDPETSFDIVLAAVSGKALYIIYEGQISVYLKRGEQLNSLTVIGQSGQIISGFLTHGDRVFLATNSLVSFLGDDLKSNLQLPFENWEEELNTRISSNVTQQQGLAGLILDLKEESTIDSDNLEKPLPPITQTAQKISNFLLSIKRKFVKQKQIEDQPLWEIKQGRSQKAVIKLLLGLTLILILCAGIGLQYKKNRDQSINLEFQQFFDLAKNEFASAQSLKTVNSTEAGQKLDSAVQNLDKALALKPDHMDAKNLRKALTEAKDDILQQFSASNINLFLDLKLIKPDFTVGYLSVSDNKLLLLDSSSATLALVNLNKKSQEILAGKDTLGNVTLASLNGDFAFIYSLDKGVMKLDVTNKKATSVAKVDKKWGEITDIYGFASNIYLLDKSNQIWKYIPAAAGYSDSKEYLLKDVKADFKDALRMQIESSVYVMKKGGVIVKFTKGSSDFFSLSGLDKGIKDPKSFFVSSDTDNLYILDSGNSRLVVVDKKGVYKAQYQADKFASSSDLVVDEKGKKAYLLEGNKIYSLDLK